MDCIFCKIIKGDIPSKVAYEDEYCYAFHDINPQTPTHILVVPKEHIPSVDGVTTENCSIVATGVKQSDAMTAYKKLLHQNNITTEGDTAKTEITVNRVTSAMVSGVATVYVTEDDGNVYKGYLEADEALILIGEGDRLEINYTESSIPQIRVISSWSFAE